MQPFTAAEVRARLRLEPSEGQPRTRAVHSAASNVGGWVTLLPAGAEREAQLSLAAARLPSVVFWYRHGLSAEEIGRRLAPFGEYVYGERAIDAACTLIAALLNQHER
ncbi:MAG: hypothetical protein JO023_23725 [Chloroflexi bacterium]|nr:hypothetical protein [Chloroflexota bacterium]